MKNLKTFFFDLKQGCVLSESEEDECEEFFWLWDRKPHILIHSTNNFIFKCKLCFAIFNKLLRSQSEKIIILEIMPKLKICCEIENLGTFQRKETKDQVWVLKQGSVLKQEDSILERWKKMTTKRKALGISEKKVEKDVNEKEGSSLTLGIKR